MKLLLLPLLLGACVGAVPVGQPSPDPTPTVIGIGAEPANRIIVYRPAEFGPITNIATAPALLLDGRAVGTCRIGAPLVLRVPDGTWAVGALTEAGQVTENVSISGGSTEYLRCGTEAAPALRPTPKLTSIPAATASREAGI